jgi:hypothetical protein
MTTVRGNVTRWVATAFPGWVEIVFVDADGKAVEIVDKLPIFGIDVAADADLPAQADIGAISFDTARSHSTRGRRRRRGRPRQGSATPRPGSRRAQLLSD